MESIINGQTNSRKTGRISVKLRQRLKEFFMIEAEFVIRIIQRLKPSSNETA